MDEKELIKIITDLKIQMGIMADSNNNIWRLIGSLFGFAGAGLGAIWAAFNGKYKKITDGIKADAATMFKHNAEEFERLTDRVELIDKTNLEYDKVINDLYNAKEHEKNLIDEKFDSIKKLCDERHKRP